MNTAFYTGVAGMIAFQEHMNTTAHNMANVRTSGYKAGMTSFSDLIYTKMNQRAGDEEKLTGHGAKVKAIDINASQAGFNMTGRELDFAIDGEGFFAIENEDGIRYTRNGAFSISAEGNRGYLVSALDGSYVLNARGNKISLPREENSTVGFDTSNINTLVGVFSFDNVYGLGRSTGSAFTETEQSGKATSITGSGKYKLVGGTLENSNVQISDEMLNIIQAQRAYQMNSTVVRTADEMEERINNLR